MIGDYPIVSFDTSAHNRLAEDGVLSEPMLVGLRLGIFFRFAGLSIEEMFAHPEYSERRALFAYCRRLQGGPNDCIYPHNEMLKRLILYHSKDPEHFNWRTVNVRALEMEKEIQRHELIADESLSAEQRLAQFEAAKEYKQLFAGLRPKLAIVFATQGETPPPTFREAIARAEAATPNLTLAIGKLLYDRAAGTDSSEGTIREFIDVCPPFRALTYAMLMTWYHESIRDRHTGEKFMAGRNDLFMSAHLPYCDKFITAEKHREQEKCLREIVAVARLDTEILSYDDFLSGFLVKV